MPSVASRAQGARSGKFCMERKMSRRTFGQLGRGRGGEAGCRCWPCSRLFGSESMAAAVSVALRRRTALGAAVGRRAEVVAAGEASRVEGFPVTKPATGNPKKTNEGGGNAEQPVRN